MASDRDPIPLRLPEGQEGDIIREWLENSAKKSIKKFNRSDALREAILAYITGVTITFEPEGDIIKEWLENSANKSVKGFSRSDALREAILAYITGVTITFDPKDPRDQRIIEEIRHLEDEPRRMSEWIKARLWERLTGLDSVTGEPIAEFVKVIETEKIVIQERVTLVEKPIYLGSVPPEQESPAASDLDQEAHNQLNDVPW